MADDQGRASRLLDFTRRAWKPLVAATICVLIGFFYGADITWTPFTLTYSEPSGLSQFFAKMFLDAALAIVVAVAAVELVERSSKKRLELDRKTFEQQTKQITEASSRAVARNLWGEDFSVEVFDETMATNFANRFLRENYLHELTFEPVPDASHVVRVKQLLEYTAVNPSKTDESFDPVFSMDDTNKLYPDDRFIRRPVMTGVRIGETVFTREQLEKLNHDLYSSDDPHELLSPAVPLGHYKLLRDGGRMRVRFTYESVEPIDSHWHNQIFVPTKGATVVVTNRVGPSLSIFLLPLFKGEFSPRDDFANDGTQWERTYAGVVLPYSGWILRWNERQVRGRA